MRFFFRKHKNKLLLAAVILLVLAAAYIFTEKPQDIVSQKSETSRVTQNSISSQPFSELSVSLNSTLSEPSVVVSADEPSSDPSSVIPSEVHDVPSLTESEPSKDGSAVVSEPSASSEYEGSAVVSEPPASSEYEGSVVVSETSATSESKVSVVVSEPSASSGYEGSAVVSEPSASSEYEGSAVVLEPSDVSVGEVSLQNVCTFGISCAVLTDKTEILPKNKRLLVPSDGVLLSPVSVAVEEGESVFDVTARVCREQGIPFEFTMTPVYHTAYIEGIGNLYEFDGGSASGWVYTVNGEQPGVGCSDYPVHRGDVLMWHYTCALGRDIP